MGLFNKGEGAANGIRQALSKRGIRATIDCFSGIVTASATNSLSNDTTLEICWDNKELTVEFMLGSDPGHYRGMLEYVKQYNETQPVYSKAELCHPQNINEPACYKFIISGSIPGAKVADKANEVEFFLDMILEEIFDERADLIKKLCFVVDLINVKN